VRAKIDELDVEYRTTRPARVEILSDGETPLEPSNTQSRLNFAFGAAGGAWMLGFGIAIALAVRVDHSEPSKHRRDTMRSIIPRTASRICWIVLMTFVGAGIFWGALIALQAIARDYSILGTIRRNPFVQREAKLDELR